MKFHYTTVYVLALKGVITDDVCVDEIPLAIYRAS